LSRCNPGTIDPSSLSSVKRRRHECILLIEISVPIDIQTIFCSWNEQPDLFKTRPVPMAGKI
jgi:hypothetical protein